MLQAELRRQEQIEHNRGVYIAATLAAAPLPEATAEQKGVRRHADKIVLPGSLSSELMKQGAHEQGLSFWRVAARDGRATVASALEFSAPEGVVLLPRKVCQSLWGTDVRTHTKVAHRCLALLPAWRRSRCIHMPATQPMLCTGHSTGATMRHAH